MSNIDEITLKWGTLKSWDLKTEAAQEAADKYLATGIPMSAMMARDNDEQKELLCALIDAATCDTIYLSWDGKDVSKEEAKEYVRNYGKKS